MDKKPCVRCERPIDAIAKICPFCNWNQDEAAPVVPLPAPEAAAPGTEATAPSATYSATKKARSDERRRAGMRFLIISAAIVLLVATFAVGGLVYSLSNRESERIERTAEVPSEIPASMPDLQFGSHDPSSTVGRSLTTAPVPGAAVPGTTTMPEYGVTDATALPSEQYSQILQNQAQTPPTSTSFEPVDPRTIQPPPRPAPPVRRPAEPRPSSGTAGEREVAVEREARGEREASRTNRTNPKPISQPLPDMKGLKQGGTASMELTIGADGRVKGVDVKRSVPGLMPRLISAVQRWKFKPATENGVPVEGQFTVDISFNADE